MQVIEPGVLYALSSFTGSEVQLLRFTVKRPTGKFDNGTTIEELLSVALDKLRAFELRFSSPHNQLAIKRLEEAQEAMRERLKSKLSARYASLPDSSN